MKINFPVVNRFWKTPCANVEEHGRIQICVYQLHDLSASEFQSLINSLLPKLQHHETILTYAWLFDKHKACCRLILFFRGAGDINDLFSVADLPAESFEKVDCILVDPRDFQQNKDWLVRLLVAIGGTLIPKSTKECDHD